MSVSSVAISPVPKLKRTKIISKQRVAGDSLGVSGQLFSIEKDGMTIDIAKGEPLLIVLM